MDSESEKCKCGQCEKRRDIKYNKEIVIQFLLLLLLGLCALFFPDAALAADPFRVNESDQSIIVLKEIIGDWSGGLGGTPISPMLSEALRIFNSAILMFAALIFAYTALVGVVQSAHDGQILGKNWSSVWVPIRFAGGVSFLFPTASGLCLAQLGALWLLSQGVGLASTVWAASVEKYNAAQPQLLAVQSVSKEEVRRTLQRVLIAELCVAHMQNAGFDFAAQRVMLDKKFWHLTGSSGGDVYWGGAAGSGYARDFCGHVKVPDTIGGFWKTSNPATAKMGYAQVDALVAAAAGMRPVAQAFVQHSQSSVLTVDNIRNALAFAADRYADALAAAMSDVIVQANAGLTKSVVEDAKKNGWLSAGTWYYQLARINGEISTIASSLPKVTHSITSDGAAVLSGLEPQQADIFKYTIQAIDLSFEDAYRTSRSIRDDGMVDAGSATADANVLKKGLNSLSQFFLSDSSAEKFGFDVDNPAPGVVQLKSVGDHLITTMQAALVTVGVLKVAGDKIDALASVGSVTGPLGAVISGAAKLVAGPVNFAMFVGSTAIIAIFVSALVLAYWLPLMPFIIWIGAVVGWVISSLELLVAVPIWIAAHMHPEGDGAASRSAAPGYMVILELVARPVLMIFGLIIAMLIVDPLLGFVSGTYFNAVSTVHADTLNGPTSFVMTIVIYVVLCWLVINLTFKTISGLPGNVMRWIGGHAGSNSEMADGLGESARHMVAAAAVNTGRSVEHLGRKSRGSGGSPGGGAGGKASRVVGGVADGIAQSSK